MNRRTTIGGLVLGLLLAGAGIVIYQIHDARQNQEKLILNCSTCDALKANQLKLRESLQDQGAEEAVKE